MVPTDPPQLDSVLFEDTATYHWPQFNKNVTNAFGENPTDGFTEVDGPNMFKKGIALASDDDQVRITEVLVLFLMYDHVCITNQLFSVPH